MRRVKPTLKSVEAYLMRDMWYVYSIWQVAFNMERAIDHTRSISLNVKATPATLLSKDGSHLYKHDLSK